MSPLQAFLSGSRDSLGLCLPTALFGFLFGVAAVASGLAPTTAIALSATVLAGSAQFAAIALWQAPLPLGTLAITSALVGARHVLMGITLTPIARPVARWQRWLGVFVLTDFNWAQTVTARPAKRRFPYFVGSGVALYVFWNLGTAVGVLVPDLLDEELRAASAAAGTLFLAGITTALAKATGRPAALPLIAAAGAAFLANAVVGATLAPLAAVAAGGLVFLGRAVLGRAVAR